MQVLAFDTATQAASVALVRDGLVLGERLSSAARLLADAETLFAEAGAEPRQTDGIVVGTGPGRYTSLRMGLVTARALAFALDAPVAGISTLDALAAGTPGALPVIDARRTEVFTLSPRPTGLSGQAPSCLRPDDVRPGPGQICVGDGAIVYRETLERAGGIVPPDDDPAHVPWARHHAGLATAFGPAELAEPIYLRAPDADKALARARAAG